MRLCDSGEIIGVKQAGVEQQALDWSVAGVPPLVIARIGNYLPTLLCFPCMDNYMLSLNGAMLSTAQQSSYRQDYSCGTVIAVL